MIRHEELATRIAEADKCCVFCGERLNPDTDYCSRCKDVDGGET